MWYIKAARNRATKTTKVFFKKTPGTIIGVFDKIKYCSFCLSLCNKTVVSFFFSILLFQLPSTKVGVQPENEFIAICWRWWWWWWWCCDGGAQLWKESYLTTPFGNQNTHRYPHSAQLSSVQPEQGQNKNSRRSEKRRIIAQQKELFAWIIWCDEGG